MPAPLAISVALMTGAAMLLAFAASRFCQTRRRQSLVAASTVALLLLHALYLHDNLSLARLLPTANLLIYGNLSPFFAAGLAGGLAATRLPRWRKAILLTALTTLTLHRAYGFLLEPCPRIGRDTWTAAVCRQTTPSTCSPAAAATLLAQHGIPATEAEMSALCLTRAAGTSMLGLYRGLSLKTANTPWQVAIHRGPLSALPHTPALVSAGLPRQAALDPRYERTWGWTPGVKHTIVYLGPAPPDALGRPRVQIADPSVGPEKWFTQGLQDLWQGEALYLIPAAHLS